MARRSNQTRAQNPDQTSPKTAPIENFENIDIATIFNAMDLSSEEQIIHQKKIKSLLLDALQYEHRLDAQRYAQLISASLISFGIFMGVLIYKIPGNLIIPMISTYLFHLANQLRLAGPLESSPTLLNPKPTGLLKAEVMTELAKTKPKFFITPSNIPLTQEHPSKTKLPWMLEFIFYETQNLKTALNQCDPYPYFLSKILESSRSFIFYVSANIFLEKLGLSDNSLASQMLMALLPFSWCSSIQISYFDKTPLIETLSQRMPFRIMNQKKQWLALFQPAYDLLLQDHAEKIQELKQALGILFILNYEFKVRQKTEQNILFFSSFIALFITQIKEPNTLPNSLIGLCSALVLIPYLFSLFNQLFLAAAHRKMSPLKLPLYLQQLPDYLLSTVKENSEKTGLPDLLELYKNLIIDKDNYYLSKLADLWNFKTPAITRFLNTQQCAMSLAYLFSISWLSCIDLSDSISGSLNQIYLKSSAWIFAGLPCVFGYWVANYKRHQKNKAIENLFKDQIGQTAVVIQKLNPELNPELKHAHPAIHMEGLSSNIRRPF